jgi:hypothetical protein
MKDTFIDIVKQYIIDNPNLNYSGIAELIQKDGTINRSHRTLRLFVAEVAGMIARGEIDTSQPDCPDVEPDDFLITEVEFEDGSELETPTDTDSMAVDSLLQGTEKYNVYNRANGGDCYNMEYGGVSYDIAVNVVDQAFLAHSRAGLNLTEQQVINLLEIDKDQFRVIKTRLGLCKDSSTVGPYTEFISTPEEIYKLIADLTGDLLKSLSNVDDPIRATLIREVKKQAIISQNKNVLFESFVKDLKTSIGKIEIRSLKGQTNGSADGAEITAILSDLHFGVVNEKYNLKIAESKLAEVQEHINLYASFNPEVSINIALPGDIMHNISGVMHPNSWKHTEVGVWGANAIIKPFELLLNFLLGITNLSSVYIIGGNHDRLNANKQLENTAEGAKLLAYMLKAVLPSPIIVEFDSRIIKFNSGNLRFIFQHGDLGADKKKKVEEVVWEHGDPERFNLVITGHHHSRIIARGDDTHKAMRISVPSFSPEDDYAKDCGYSNNPAIIIIAELHGRPVITDIPLVY